MTDTTQAELRNALRDFKVPNPVTGNEDYFPYLWVEPMAAFIVAHTEEKVREADDKAHMIGFKNGKWAITSNLKIWVEKRARVTNVQNIDGIRNGQYVRVDDLLDRIKALTNKGKGDTNE